MPDKRKIIKPEDTKEAPRSYSFEDELFKEIIADEGGADARLAFAIESRPQKFKEKKKLRPRDIFFMAVAVVVIIGIVLAIVLPDILATQTDNFAETKVTEGSLTLNINATGTLVFAATHQFLAGHSSVFTFKTQSDPEESCEYLVTELFIANDTRILDLDMDFVLFKVREISRTGAPWQITDPAEFDVTVQDVIGEGITFDDPLLTFVLENAYINSVHIYEFSKITDTSTKLFTATDYTRATVAVTLSQYEINNIRIAEENSEEPLEAKVTFTSPSGSLYGKLLPISRTPAGTSGQNQLFSAIIELNIPPRDSDSSVNAGNVVGGTVAVAIQTGERTGLIVPVYAIYNDGSNDYVLVKKSPTSNSTAMVYVDIVLSNGKNAIIKSDDERIYNGAVIYYEKEDSFLSSLGI